MRWLVTGAGGRLGTELVAQLSGHPDEVVALGRTELDITASAAVTRAVADAGPDVVVNAAAYTDVDGAEAREDDAYRVNATGAAVLAVAVARFGARLIHVSTDYVFDGTAARPYEVDDPVAPLNAYGRTKLAGEVSVRELLPDSSWVVRSAWLYGAGGADFVGTMQRLERARDTVRVVDDQRGSPTWTRDLARGLVQLGRSGAPAGVYHCTGSGDTTRFELARAVFELIGADPGRVRPVTMDEFPSPARRAAFSVLSSRSWRHAGLTELPHWHDSLRTFLTPDEPLSGRRTS